MDEPARLARQLRLALDGDAWLGTNLQAVLAGIDHETASARPIAGANTIWELVQHLAVTQELCLLRFGGADRPMTEADFFPPMPPPSAEAWEELLARWRANEERLVAIAERFPAARLDEAIVPGCSSAYDTLAGHVQHNLYHGGQIVLLRRAAAR
jgi:uncharacterized damage-inducible protein DinB